MKLERINTVKGFCAKRSQRIPELHRNNALIGFNVITTVKSIIFQLLPTIMELFQMLSIRIL